ncbi:unnamed protein product [Brassica oleracea]|uniref:(rape) hypothetical protein n=1 Tax=Brassica napus TaxID=3708 RepID=A0A816K2B1_BRANA|nr:unnamed protein product [Brassica napus]
MKSRCRIDLPFMPKTQMCLKLLTDMRDTIGLHVKLLLHWVTFFRLFFKSCIAYRWCVLVHHLPFSHFQRIQSRYFFIVIKHSVNVVFLLGETFLNSLVCISILSLLKHNNMMMVIVLMTLMMISLFTQWFPLFRISYFVLWTGVFVILQWIVHACVSWYAAVGLMHVPCFGVFALIVKLKYMWFSKCFSEEP